MYLILGYLGYGNYGDELLASIVETHLEENCPRLSKKNSLWQHLHLISESKILIGVGGLFQDASSLLSPWYYFLVILYASFCNKRIVLLGQGIGPLNSPISKFITYISFKLANKISVRDSSSSKLLTQLKINHYYGSDLAWSLTNDELFGFAEAELVAHEHHSKTLICLRETKETPAKIANLVKEMLLDADSEPMFLIMQDSDESFTRSVMEELQVSAEIIHTKNYEPHALIRILKDSFTVMISMRLHALILAHIAGLELRAIVCDPKLDELLIQIKEYDLLELSQRAEDSLKIN